MKSSVNESWLNRLVVNCSHNPKSRFLQLMHSLSRCLLEEASAIAAVERRLTSDQVEAALTLLECCADRKAKLVITGVGKRGSWPARLLPRSPPSA